MLSEKTKGVYVISATPFSPGGEIDYPSVASLIEFYLESGVHGITILGMMGEAHKLTFSEAETFTRYAISTVAGRVPVVVAVSNSALANVAALARAAMDAGAAGVLLAPVPGLRSDDQVFSYVGAALQALGPSVPVAYQDYPYSTGVYLSASLFNRLVEGFPQLVMLKHEDCPGLGKLSQIRSDAAGRSLRRVSILVGNGGLYFPQELRRGADGAMTGFAYPEMLVEVYERFVSGDAEGAEDLFDVYLPIVRHEQQPGFGLAVRKELLRRRGAIASATVRSPGPALGGTDLCELDSLQTRLARALERYRRRDKEPVR
jgi:4-hydroxy-tetrahydrodipicolinate synthase